jgi:tartronate-semialdehyde synthase
VFKPADIIPAFEKARALMKQHSVPVVVEIILERVTNIAMGTDIDAINEFNEVLDVK